MALPIERWAKEAVELERNRDFTPVADTRVLRDIEDLSALHCATWRRREMELILSGELLAMAQGSFGAFIAYPPVLTHTTTSINGTVNLYPNLVYSPIPANSILTPQGYRVAITAKITTSTSPANIGINPLINTTGTWSTGGTAVSGGTTLGATGNVALTASITNAFYYITGDLTIRATGTTGSIANQFHFVSTQATASGLAGPAVVGAGMNLLFGGTVATPDFVTALQSLQFGAVHTVTTITHNVESVHFLAWN